MTLKLLKMGPTDRLSNDVFQNNCPELDIKPENDDFQNEIEEIFENNNVDFKLANMKELQSWASNKVYSTVSKTTKKCMSLRWVLITKETTDGIIPKARLVARGFEEDCLDKSEKESPTCSKESLRTLFLACAQNEWQLQSVDIKTAFLQGNLLNRDVYINPPREAGCPSTHKWKLNKCVYGLCDASLKWYSRFGEFVAKNNGKI